MPGRRRGVILFYPVKISGVYGAREREERDETMKPTKDINKCSFIYSSTINTLSLSPLSLYIKYNLVGIIFLRYLNNTVLFIFYNFHSLKYSGLNSWKNLIQNPKNKQQK
jgi:hypothetical protein